MANVKDPIGELQKLHEKSARDLKGHYEQIIERLQEASEEAIGVLKLRGLALHENLAGTLLHKAKVFLTGTAVIRPADSGRQIHLTPGENVQIQWFPDATVKAGKYRLVFIVLPIKAEEQIK